MRFKQNNQKGFSLVDALIGFALVAVVASSYLVIDYSSAEANVSEALGLSVAAAQALEETCSADANAVVRDNLDAGYFYVPSGGDDDYISRIALGADCARQKMVVVVWTVETGAEVDPIIELSAIGQGNDVAWTCHLIAGEPRDVPDFCRAEYGHPAG